MLDTFLGTLQQGGYVMPPMVLGAMLLWYGAGYRALLLRGGSKRSAREVLDTFDSTRDRQPSDVVEQAAYLGVRIRDTAKKTLSHQLESELGALVEPLSALRVPMRTVVTVAPLLGLLGTVSGMIETFASLGDMAMHSSSGGIAGGISQALLTTQFGLAIAIPGVLVVGLLDRRQAALESQIEELRTLLSEGGATS